MNSVPKKFERTFPKYPVTLFSILSESVLITYFDVAYADFFFPASKNLLLSERTKLYFGHNRISPVLTRRIVVRI